VNVKVLILLGLISLSNYAHGEGGTCPDGYYPQNGGGVNGCIPIPNYDNAQPEHPQVRWENRWGAIAFDGGKGVLGAVTGARSKKLANKAAIAQCRANGGGDNCKKSPFSYTNQCAAIAWGQTSYRGGGRSTIEEAKKDALLACTSATTKCEIVYAACSLPERVQ